MEVKLVKTESFYPIMQQWWKGHNFSEVSPSMLPETTFVCFKDDVPIYSMCFYNTDSNLCWLGWQIANPDTTRRQRRGGLRYLFTEIEKYARYVGYHVMFTTSNTPSVEATMKERDFQTGDTNVNHYIKIL